MKKILTIIGLAAVTLAGAQAQVIINYTPVLTALPSGSPASVTASGVNIDAALVSASTLSRGTGAGTASGTGRFNGQGFNSSTLAAAITADDFYTFNVAPVAAVTLNFSSITFSIQSSGTGGDSYGIFSSIGGFAAANVIQTASGLANATTALTVNNATLGSAFDAVTTATTFRIYVFGASLSTGTSSINALQVNAIPEPTTSLLIGLGSAFMLWNLRRRRSIVA